MEMQEEEQDKQDKTRVQQSRAAVQHFPQEKS